MYYSKKDKENLTRKVYDIFYKKTVSRRMAVTEAGKPDQTYSITNQVNQWLVEGRAQVVKIAKCERSGEFVEFITTNPDNFIEPDTSQYLMMFTS